MVIMLFFVQLESQPFWLELASELPLWSLLKIEKFKENGSEKQKGKLKSVLHKKIDFEVNC